MTQEPVFSVGEFLDFVNEVLGAQDVFVQGEVTKWTVHPKGVFFTLKDADGASVLEGYASPYIVRGLGFAVELGMLLKVGGIPNVYKARGTFSIRAETIEPFGEGAHRKAYEALKKKLQEEGLFSRKRSLPEFISHIGIITSGTGAVIDDFRKNLLPLGLNVSMVDARVQGADAVRSIRAAIELFQGRRESLDVLVIMRGGGSAEDLDVFNNEYVVRSIFGSVVPTIAAIGHHRDVPLAAMVADQSPSTPSIAAGLINSSWDRLRNLGQTAQQLEHAFDSVLGSALADVDAHTHRLATHLARLAGRGRELQQSLAAALERVGHGIARMRQTVDAAARQLVAANPERQLRLGYSIVTDATGAVVRSVGQLRHGQTLATRLARGSFTSEVKELESKGLSDDSLS